MIEPDSRACPGTLIAKPKLRNDDRPVIIAAASQLRPAESIGYDDPFFRVTTFWGDPARHDAFADIAWWLSFLGLEYRPRGSESDLMVRFAAAAPTVELWHDADLPMPASAAMPASALGSPSTI